MCATAAQLPLQGSLNSNIDIVTTVAVQCDQEQDQPASLLRKEIYLCTEHVRFVCLSIPHLL